MHNVQNATSSWDYQAPEETPPRIEETGWYLHVYYSAKNLCFIFCLIVCLFVRSFIFTHVEGKHTSTAIDIIINKGLRNNAYNKTLA